MVEPHGRRGYRDYEKDEALKGVQCWMCSVCGSVGGRMDTEGKQVGIRLEFKDRLGDFSGSPEVKTPHFLFFFFFFYFFVIH